MNLKKTRKMPWIFIDQPLRAAEIGQRKVYRQNTFNTTLRLPMAPKDLLTILKECRTNTLRSLSNLCVVLLKGTQLIYTHQTWPVNDHYVTMDFFKFDMDGKI
jgi:hypothetical protein